MDNNETIKVHIKKIEGLLYTSTLLLPGNRLLDKDVEEYIIEQAEGLPKNDHVTINIQYHEKEYADEKEIGKAIRRHFANCGLNQKYELKHTLKLGWTSLITGFGFLIMMYLLSTIVLNLLPTNAIMITVKELFIILGWVALWRPAELLLYEWRPYKRKMNLYDRLSKSRIEFNNDAHA